VVYEVVEQFVTNVRAPVGARSRVRRSPASFMARGCQCSKGNTSFCLQTYGSCISHGSCPRFSRTWYVLHEVVEEASHGFRKVGLSNGALRSEITWLFYLIRWPA
jgi:hypothetical protein